ncbi:MAG: hypothetical protein HY266_10705, partial [Deltaproteobacteria bacterium]|nr:hypothetical protein [Deltaproteobacteria bacterium]
LNPPLLRGTKGVVEVDWFMRIGMMLPAVACLGLGVFPTFFIQWMDIIPEQLTGSKIAASAGAFGWMWLTPVSHERASYSGPIVFLGILAVVVVTYLLLHVRRTAIHRAPIWDCGFGKLTSRMQYTATSFSMPIRRIFGFIFNIKEQVRKTGAGDWGLGTQRQGLGTGKNQPPAPSPKPLLHYHLRIRDRFWGWIYEPIADLSFWIARKVGMLQQGKIHIYLIYSFVTIIILLVFFR